MKIQAMHADQWQDVRQIYLDGIATGQATFQTDAPSWKEWDDSHIANLRYVAIIDNQITGWAALSPVSSRCVYAGVAEVSVYVDRNFRGKGVGYQLLKHLIESSERQNIWTLQAGIFPENMASIKLHEKAGFRLIGIRERVAKQYGKWRDVEFLERRSSVTGIN